MKTQRILLGLLATLTAGTFVPAQDGKKEPPGDKPKGPPAKVAMEMLPSRHFVVSVKINGEGPFRMILDTGAPITLINSATGKKAGLKGGGGLFGGMNTVPIKSLVVGGVEATDSTAVVMDHPTVKAISDAFEADGGPIVGIVGFPFFAKFAMTVDYEKKELSLTPNGYQPGDYMKDLMKNLNNADALNKPRSVMVGGLWGFEIGKEKEDDKDGVTLLKVYPDTPAAKAGLKAGDRLLTLDGRWTDTLGDATIAASLVKPGKAAELKLTRDGKELTVPVTPAKKPAY